MVARKGEAADWLIFNVKKGTALEDKTKTPAEDPGTKVPGLSISEVGHLYHVLTITNPDAPTSKAKPKGIKDIQVYRALVADGAPAPADSDYEYIGDASRGRFISEFDSADVKKIAWYKARYENTLGKTGNFCNPESETVI
jgi:hypothetical protein